MNRNFKCKLCYIVGHVIVSKGLLKLVFETEMHAFQNLVPRDELKLN